jgi:hypothetical protein
MIAELIAPDNGAERIGWALFSNCNEILLRGPAERRPAASVSASRRMRITGPGSRAVNHARAHGKDLIRRKLLGNVAKRQGQPGPAETQLASAHHLVRVGPCPSCSDCMLAMPRRS